MNIDVATDISVSLDLIEAELDWSGVVNDTVEEQIKVIRNIVESEVEVKTNGSEEEGTKDANRGQVEETVRVSADQEGARKPEMVADSE